MHIGHVAIYTRVSTEDQVKEGFSLEAQKERLEAYCRARDWVITGVYVDDGYSGRDTKRPAYRRLLEERDSWDTILVLRMDRIHRNARHFMEMMDDLRSWGKDFASATESLDTSTAMGRFVMDIVQRIAQLESEQIGERVYMGMAQKARTGSGHLGFRAPLGYRHEGGRLSVQPSEAQTVQTIFELCLDGKSLEEVARHLNARGARTKSNATWAPIKVFRVLHNPVYAGYLRWDGLIRRGDHEALVPLETFNRTQEILRARSFASRTRRPPLTLED